MSLLGNFDFTQIDMESVVDNSYKDFHAKGLDYLCLQRSLELTIKVYFFESGIQDVGEVVNPHDHRYSFETVCLSGVIRNKWFRRLYEYETTMQGAEFYNAYEWRTPLLGGNGFTYCNEQRLITLGAQKCYPGEHYYMSSHELHTIQVMAPETVIVLYQYEDEVPPELPTLTFTRSSEPPDLTGLYNKFTSDQVMKRINLLKELL